MRKGRAKSKVGKYLINHSEVARRLGLSPSYVCMLFNGQRQNLKRMKQIEDLIIEELAIADRCWRKAAFRPSSSIHKEGSDGGKNQ